MNEKLDSSYGLYFTQNETCLALSTDIEGTLMKI